MRALREPAKPGSLKRVVGRIGVTNWNGVERTVKVRRVSGALAFVDYVTDEGDVIEDACCLLRAIEFDSPNNQALRPARSSEQKGNDGE